MGHSLELPCLAPGVQVAATWTHYLGRCCGPRKHLSAVKCTLEVRAVPDQVFSTWPRWSGPGRLPWLSFSVSLSKYKEGLRSFLCMWRGLKIRVRSDGNCTFEQRDFNSEGTGAITMIWGDFFLDRIGKCLYTLLRGKKDLELSAREGSSVEVVLWTLLLNLLLSLF